MVQGMGAKKILSGEAAVPYFPRLCLQGINSSAVLLQRIHKVTFFILLPGKVP